MKITSFPNPDQANWQPCREAPVVSLAPPYRAQCKYCGKEHLDIADVLKESKLALLTWAIARWQAEVSQRPLRNIYRRILDDTWRQVIRFAGGNPEELIGPAHDDLLAGNLQK